jgi:hypothetical protein
MKPEKLAQAVANPYCFRGTAKISVEISAVLTDVFSCFPRALQTAA